MSMRQDEEAESAEFQLPLLGLFGDLEAGRGSVRLQDDFTTQAAAVQLGLLRDWQQGLQAYRHAALAQLARELSAEQPGLSRGEALSRLRAACASIGIDVPDEIESLLH